MCSVFLCDNVAVELSALLIHTFLYHAYMDALYCVHIFCRVCRFFNLFFDYVFALVLARSPYLRRQRLILLFELTNTLQ